MWKSFAAVLGALMVLGGCGICKPTTGTNESHQQAIKVIYHTDYIPVITKIDIPEISSEHTIRDTASHLENKFAESDARINPDGSLYHSLKTKPQTIQQEQEVKVEYRDSIVTQTDYKEINREVKVERELTGWQKFLMRGFWVLLALVAFAYRKYIIAIVKKIIALIA